MRDTILGFWFFLKKKSKLFPLFLKLSDFDLEKKVYLKVDKLQMLHVTYVGQVKEDNRKMLL